MKKFQPIIFASVRQLRFYNTELYVDIICDNNFTAVTVLYFRLDQPNYYKDKFISNDSEVDTFVKLVKSQNDVSEICAYICFFISTAHMPPRIDQETHYLCIKKHITCVFMYLMLYI